MLELYHTVLVGGADWPAASSRRRINDTLAAYWGHTPGKGSHKLPTPLFVHMIGQHQVSGTGTFKF